MPILNVDPPRRRFNTKEASFDVKSETQNDEPGKDPGKKNQPFILDMVTCEKLFLQTIPLELGMNPETGWNVVMAAGRNTPLYQYTGAEDSLSFTLTWYADEENKQDALRKVKWIEALGKNNGYDEKPHHVKFVFGKMFQDAEWIVFAMPYKMSVFDRESGMFPNQIQQEITLKRILTRNRLSNQIRKIDT